MANYLTLYSETFSDLSRGCCGFDGKVYTVFDDIAGACGRRFPGQVRAVGGLADLNRRRCAGESGQAGLKRRYLNNCRICKIKPQFSNNILH